MAPYVDGIKEYIGKCDICMAHRAIPDKEPLQQHDFVARPWSKVGADLCHLQGCTLLVLCDYYSNFIEVENISKITTQGVSKGLKIMFSRYGIPNKLVSDNGPQFSSADFTLFSKSWGFNHVASSQHYPQSNGKAENAVKTVKRLFMKCRDSGQLEYLALLDWRNTPSEGIGTSPAQRFLGRRCKPDCQYLDNCYNFTILQKMIQKLWSPAKSGKNTTMINMQSPSNQLQLGIQSGSAFLAKPHGVLESVQIHWDQEAMQLKWEKGYSGAIAANSFVLTISLSLLWNQHLNQSSHIGLVQYQKGTVQKMANRV